MVLPGSSPFGHPALLSCSVETCTPERARYEQELYEYSCHPSYFRCFSHLCRLKSDGMKDTNLLVPLPKEEPALVFRLCCECCLPLTPISCNILLAVPLPHKHWRCHNNQSLILGSIKPANDQLPNIKSDIQP